MNFVEGFQYTKGEKIDYDNTIKSTLQGILMEIRAWTVKEALKFDKTRTLTPFKTMKEFHSKYTARYGLTKHDITV